MRRRTFGEYPFVAVAALVGGLTVGLVILGLELHWGAYAYLLVAIPIGIAVAYLVSYSRVVPPVPVVPPPTPAAPTTKEEEVFRDPVEEADRIASGETLPPPPPD